MGSARVQPSNLTATFTVGYAPGTLEALCVNRSANGAIDGSGVLPHASASLATAGPPTALSLSADRPTIRHDCSDLAYVTASVVDARGVRVPHAAGVEMCMRAPLRAHRDASTTGPFSKCSCRKRG